MEIVNNTEENLQNHSAKNIEQVINGLPDLNHENDPVTETVNDATENKDTGEKIECDAPEKNCMVEINMGKEKNAPNEVNGSATVEHNESNFLDNITLATDPESDNNENTESTSKYDDKDAVRRVLIKGINRKKSADDIEDYFFDNYAESGIEEVSACFVPGKKKWFNGVAIVTFETELQAQKFLNIDLKNEEEIAYKQKLYRISLAENKKKREAKKKEEMEVQKVADSIEYRTSRTIVCTGFANAAQSITEIQNYMRDNHENVVNVFIDQKKTVLKFTDHKAANKFLSLPYVKFKGIYITRKWGEDVRRGEKRKVDMSDTRSGYQNKGPIKGAQFKLKGFKNSSTNYRTIKQSLEQSVLDRKDVRFINYSAENLEAVVILHTAKAKDVVLKLNKTGLNVNGDRVTAQILTGSEEDTFLEDTTRTVKWHQNMAKKVNDWSDY